MRWSRTLAVTLFVFGTFSMRALHVVISDAMDGRDAPPACADARFRPSAALDHLGAIPSPGRLPSRLPRAASKNAFSQTAASPSASPVAVRDRRVTDARRFSFSVPLQLPLDGPSLSRAPPVSA